MNTSNTAVHNPDDRQHLESLLSIHRKSLQILETQAAQYGSLAVPLHLVHQLDEQRNVLQQIQAQLTQPGASSSTEASVDYLPTPATPFVGRDQEIAAACALLRQERVRLLTLTGPGGTGKTRLSIEIAAQLRTDFAHGVRFIELDTIHDPALVPVGIAQILPITEAGNQSLLLQIKHYLRERQLLLVLDNFEHVIGAATLIADLLATAPGLKVLVSSRELLRVAAEHEYAVPPLALPDLRLLRLPNTSLTARQVDAVAQSPAVALFVQCAQTARSSFALAPDNARAVAEICVRLDGLPLAIELAAARTKLLKVQDVLSRLNDRFKLLTGGRRDVPARQQTLRGAIEWSYDLLSADERFLFTRLTLFHGGCTFESAEAVCGNAPTQPDDLLPLELDLLDGLTSLVEKSFVRQFDDAQGEPRFTMLESLREYGLEQLHASDAFDRLQQRYATWFYSLAQQAEPHFTSAQQTVWMARLEQEHDNLRAALRWLLEHQPDHAVAMAGALWRFWMKRGYPSEGREWLRRALATNVQIDPAIHAAALHGAGALAQLQADYSEARRYYAQSLGLRRQLGDKQGVARLLNNLAGIARVQGDYARAQTLYEECLALFRDLNDEWSIAGGLVNLGLVQDSLGNYERAIQHYSESLTLQRRLGDESNLPEVLNNLGLATLRTGDYERARTLLEQGLALARSLNDRKNIAYILSNLGRVAFHQGDYEQAQRCYAENLVLVWELMDKLGLATSLEWMAIVAGATCQHERAARLWGAAEALRESANIPMPPADRPDYERLVGEACAQIEPAAWAAAWAAGRALPLEQVITEALSITN